MNGETRSETNIESRSVHHRLEKLADEADDLSETLQRIDNKLTELAEGGASDSTNSGR